LAQLVRDCAETHNEIVVHGQKVAGTLPARYVPSVDRAVNELALCQRVSLSDAIRQTIGWYRADFV
jgi:nucleoside-diphosphate-sugar epimerase